MRPTLKPIRIAAPSASPLSLADAKLHLRVISSDEDALIQSYIDAAVASLEGWSGMLGGRVLIEQIWRDHFSCWPTYRRALRLSIDPAIAIASVAYLDADGAEQALDHAALGGRIVTDAAGPALIFDDAASFPATALAPDAVRVAYTAGYGATAADAPTPIVQALRLLVGHMYANREVAAPVPLAETPYAFRSLIGLYRRISL